MNADRKSALVLIGALSLLACSRSALPELDSAGSGGLAGSSAASGGTTDLGGFGAGADCTDLTRVGPVGMLAENDVLESDESPSLSYSNDALEQITIAVTREKPIANWGTSLVHSTLSPWSNWPPTAALSTTYTNFSSSELSNAFVAGQGLDGHWGALVAHSVPGGSVLSFSPYVDATSAVSGPEVTLAGASPGFVTRGKPGYQLVGTLASGALLANVVTYAGPGTNVGVLTAQLGCANSPLVADAVAYQDGWLVAVSDAANGMNGCGGVDPGPPTHIDVYFLSVEGFSHLVTTFDAGAPVSALKAVSHPSGVQLAYRVANSDGVAPIEWLRVDVASSLVMGPTDVTMPAAVPLDGFAVAGLGTKLAVIWNRDDAVSTGIVLTLLDDAGTRVAEKSIEPVLVYGAVTAIAAPNGKSVVIASSNAQPQNHLQVMLTRFDCVGG